MKKRPIILNFENPCAENWDDMSPANNGKFCSHCQKSVIDVSTFNDTQLATFLAAQKGSICLRALTTQTDRALPQPISAPSPIYRAAAAIGFSILLIAGADTFAKAPYRPLTSFITEENKEAFLQSADSVLLKGKVVDTFKNPLSNIAVKIFSDSFLHATVMSDTEGCFMIWVSKKLIAEEKLVLETDDLKYEKSRLWLTKDLTEQANSILLRLEPKPDGLKIITLLPVPSYSMGIWYDSLSSNILKFADRPIKKYRTVKKKKK